MSNFIYITRETEIKLTLPLKDVELKDGAIWYREIPVLGITDPTVKAAAVKAVKAKRYNDIPAEAFTRMGDNANGLWAGSPEEWQKHPNKKKADEEKAKKDAQKAKMIKIHLSSRGWGDYSPCEWFGDITRPDNEILSECKENLKSGHDVDRPNQTDDELLEAIHSARKSWQEAPARKAAQEKAESEDLKKKIDTGYCFNCESWCHGDCGNYSQDPMVRYKRDMTTARAEESYGINEG